MKSKGKYVSMLSYFEIPENLNEIAPNVDALWKSYLEKDEKYRNDRLKMIARCPKISFFIQCWISWISFISTVLGSL